MLDIDVAPVLLRFVTVTTTDRGAGAACQSEVTPFTGAALVGALTGAVTSTPVLDLLRVHATRVPLEVAVASRGGVLLNTAGRVGVVLAPGVVVQPAGRRYALTPTDPVWWVSGWWLTVVTRTMSAA